MTQSYTASVIAAAKKLDLAAPPSPKLVGPHLLVGDLKIIGPGGDDRTAGGIIRAKLDKLQAWWSLLEKDQTCRVTGVVTKDMCMPDGEGKLYYEFQGFGWRPKAPVGSILLQDVFFPADRWSNDDMDQFLNKSGWQGFWDEAAQELRYRKPVKSIAAACALPVGWVVESIEGRVTIQPGDLLTLTSAVKGDFYRWPAAMIEGCVTAVK